METPIPAFIPTEPEVLYSELTYEEQLNLTQNVKHKILHGVMTSRMDGVIPTDKESIDSMMKVMDSMDKTTIQNRRNQIDQEGNRSAKELVEGIAMFIKQAKNVNPFVGTTADAKGAEPNVEDLGEFEHANGEGQQGVVNESSEEFNERMEATRRAQLQEEQRALGLTP